MNGLLVLLTLLALSSHHDIAFVSLELFDPRIVSQNLVKTHQKRDGGHESDASGVVEVFVDEPKRNSENLE